MATMYYGVFCVQCGRFVQLGNYFTTGDLKDFTPSLVSGDTCPACGANAIYRREDVAHSLSPDGRNPVFQRENG